jgi:hypothetical protein
MATAHRSKNLGSRVVTLGGQFIELRATLRAAYSLEQKYEGFENLFMALISGKVSATFDVLLETVRERDRMLIVALQARPIAQIRASDLAELALGLAISMAGIDTDHDASTTAVPGEKIAYKVYFEDLFRKATGWLGWSPDQAWNATPFEIIAALEGRAEFIKLASGVNAPRAGSPAAPSSYNDAPFDEAGLAELAAMARH